MELWGAGFKVCAFDLSLTLRLGLLLLIVLSIVQLYLFLIGLLNFLIDLKFAILLVLRMVLVCGFLLSWPWLPVRLIGRYEGFLGCDLVPGR